jgi:hypothetical protein
MQQQTPMTIEYEVTGGLATWLDELRHDPGWAEVTFRTVVPGAPDAPSRRVTFTAVRDYAEEPFDAAIPREPNTLECLVGLDAHERGTATWYVIHTSEREITFYTAAPPVVERVPRTEHGESSSPAA